MKSTLFLGKTTDRDKAFSDIAAISLEIAQDPFGYHFKNGARPTRRYSKATIQAYERCVNPRCQQGGLDLQHLVEFSAQGQHRYPCRGHEGSPQGRKKGNPCDNYFDVTLAVERKKPEPT